MVKIFWLKKIDQEDKEKAGMLPLLSKYELKKQHLKQKKERNIRALRYSPIVQRYLDLKEYKTKNFMKPNKMKLNPALRRRLRCMKFNLARLLEKDNEIERLSNLLEMKTEDKKESQKPQPAK